MTNAGMPVYLLPAEVAKMLRCSEWWIKEQARRRRIPFSWIGGGYRFTEDHVREIVRLFEKRPQPGVSEPGSAAATRRQPPRLAESASTLTARVPRRTRAALQQSPTAA